MPDLLRLVASIRTPGDARPAVAAAATAAADDDEEDEEVEPHTTAGEEEDASPAARVGRRAGDRYRRLNAAFAEIVEDYNLVAFVPVSVMDAATMTRAIRTIDKSNGYVPTPAAAAAAAAQVAVQDEVDEAQERLRVAEMYGHTFSASAAAADDDDD